MAIDRNEYIAVLRVLAESSESAEMMLPKVFREYRTAKELDKAHLRLRMGVLLSKMVVATWIQPVTINGRTTYDITSAGRHELRQRTAN